MKYVICFSLLIVLGCQDSNVHINKVLRAQLDKMESAYENHNNQVIADIYTDNSYLIGPEGIIAGGRQAVDAYWKGGNSKQIRWKLEDHALLFSELEELISSDAYRSLSRKPPLWDDLDIQLAENQAYYYQLGRSTLINENNQDRGGSIVNFLLVWTEVEGEYLIYIDSYIGAS